MCSSCEVANERRRIRPKFPTPHIIFKTGEKTQEERDFPFTKGTSLENFLEKQFRQTGKTYLLHWVDGGAVIRKGNGKNG